MTGPVIVPRGRWGATPWRTAPSAVSPSRRTEFIVHYDGATPILITGPAVPRRIEAIHLGNGWAGIGYNHVVDRAGTIFEGRGWDLAGAHCPGHNVPGWGVQVAIGGDQEPTAAALRSCRALYDEGCRLAGRELAMMGHRDGYATECPGEPLCAWVRAGMPAPPAAEPRIEIEGGRDMFVIRTPRDGSFAVWPAGDHLAYRRVDDATAGRWVAGGVQLVQLGAADATALMHLQATVQDPDVPAAAVDVRALAAELVPLLPDGTALTAEGIADVMAARLAQ